MAESHPSASGAGGARATEPGILAGADRDDDALGFECANPWLQIESWAMDQAGARAGTAESVSSVS